MVQNTPVVKASPEFLQAHYLRGKPSVHALAVVLYDISRKDTH